MQPDGQVYADFFGNSPEADKRRFLMEERQALFVREAARDVNKRIEELERMLDDAEGR